MAGHCDRRRDADSNRAIALVAHRFSKQQLALQMIATFMESARNFETAMPFPIRGGKPLTQKEFEIIDADLEMKRHCNTLLNQCEVLCGCVVAGTIDLQLTRRIAGTAVTQTYLSLEPYVIHLRIKLSSEGAWQHFERTAKMWGVA